VLGWCQGTLLDIGFADVAMNDQGRDDLRGFDCCPLGAILRLALELGQGEASPCAECDQGERERDPRGQKTPHDILDPVAPPSLEPE
jgi:hypothetical protein